MEIQRHNSTEMRLYKGIENKTVTLRVVLDRKAGIASILSYNPVVKNWSPPMKKRPAYISETEFEAIQLLFKFALEYVSKTGLKLV